MIEQRFRFTLTKSQVEDLEDHLIFDDDIVSSGIEQPDGTYQFNFGYEDLEDLIESITAACNHAENKQLEERLDTIYKKLEKVLGKRVMARIHAPASPADPDSIPLVPYPDRGEEHRAHARMTGRVSACTSYGFPATLFGGFSQSPLRSPRFAESEYMKRLPLRITLLVALYASVALGGPSAEIVVAKPTQSSPGTDLRDEELQKAYDEMWTDFRSDVDAATADLKKVIGELREEAQKGGHAALTQRWDSISRDFATNGRLRWDHIKEKKEWRANYPGTVFPERYTRAVKACKNAYDQAMKDLRVAYDGLSSQLTMADKVERAGEIMKEATNTLGAEGEGPKKPVPPPLQLTLLQKLVGKWTHQKSDLMYYFLPDGTFHEDWKANGKVNATGRLVLLSTDLAEIKLSNAYRIQIRMAGDDILAVLVWDSKGNPWGQGMVLERQKDRVPPK